MADGSPRTPPRPEPPRRFVDVAWTSDGNVVWLRTLRGPVVEGDFWLIRCRVVCAAGHHARVRNEQHGIDRWASLATLQVPEGDPQSHEGTREMMKKFYRENL